MDILQDHLTRARASGGVFARWGLRLPRTIQLAQRQRDGLARPPEPIHGG